jgi:ATP-dependent 26S proteasome regulatory subunit
MVKKNNIFANQEFILLPAKFENTIQNWYQNSLRWQSLLALVPVAGSLIHVLNDSHTNKQRSVYLTHNLTTLRSTDSTTKIAERNLNGRILSSFQLAHILHQKLDRTKFHYDENLPVFINSLPNTGNFAKRNGKLAVGTAEELLNIRNLELPFSPSSLVTVEPDTKFIPNSSYKIYNAESIYKFLTTKKIYKRYKFKDRLDLQASLKFTSKTGEIKSPLNIKYPNFSTAASSNTIPDQHSSEKLTTGFVSVGTQVSGTGTNTPRILINSLTNDLILDNPNLLHKVLKRLQVQSAFQDIAFDFYGSQVRRRLKYNLCAVDSKDNPFNYDLKDVYSPFQKTKKDRGILISRSQTKNPNYSVNNRNLQNRLGNTLTTPVVHKTSVELSMQTPNNEVVENLLITLPTPLINTNLETTSWIKNYENSAQNRKPNHYSYSTIFQYLPTVFKELDSSRFLVHNHMYMGEKWWLGATQLSFTLFILQLINALYKAYQYELGLYLSEFASRLNLYDEDISNLIDEVNNSSHTRVFRDLNTSFLELGGMIELLPKFGETVLFLKNSCRPTNVSNIVPKAILLVGPPGTGKTLLVKAIGAEANVPVLIQSGNGVLEENAGVNKLQEAFKKAQDLSPCILFIDEMDSIGVKRDELSLSIHQSEVSTGSDLLNLRNNKSFTKSDGIEKVGNNAPAQVQALTQLLVELDGVDKRRGFVVFGATNRRESLDPALIRPGRFNDIIEIGLPNQQKRIEIMKIYTNKIGITTTLDWDLLSRQTVGCSAADLATIVNKSTIQSIIRETKHSQNSLVEALIKTKNGNDKVLSHRKWGDPELEQRLVFYEFGRDLLKKQFIHKTNFINFLINENEDIINPYRSFGVNQRDSLADSITQLILLFNPRAKDLLAWMMIEMAGKAAELLYVQTYQPKSSYSALSTLGEIDLLKANMLAECYEQLGTLNQSLPGIKKPITTTINISTNFSNDNIIEVSNKQYWKGRVESLELMGQQTQNPVHRKWFRVHLGNPEIIALNEEILFADLYQFDNTKSPILTDITPQLNWAELEKLESDIQIQLLLTIVLENTMLFLDQNREKLDQNVINWYKTRNNRELKVKSE